MVDLAIRLRRITAAQTRLSPIKHASPSTGSASASVDDRENPSAAGQKVSSRESEAQHSGTSDENYDMYEDAAPIIPDASSPPSNDISSTKASVDASATPPSLVSPSKPRSETAHIHNGRSNKVNLLTANPTRKINFTGSLTAIPKSKSSPVNTETIHMLVPTSLNSSTAERQNVGNPEARGNDESDAGKEAIVFSESSKKPTSLATQKPRRKRAAVNYDETAYLLLSNEEVPTPKNPPIATNKKGRCGGYAGRITKLTKLKQTTTKAVPAPVPALPNFPKRKVNAPKSLRPSSAMTTTTVLEKRVSVQPSGGGSSPRLLHTPERAAAEDGPRDVGDLFDVPGSDDTEDDPPFKLKTRVCPDCSTENGHKKMCKVRYLGKEKCRGSRDAPITLSSGPESDSDDEPDGPEAFDQSYDDVASKLDEPDSTATVLTPDVLYRVSTREALEDLLSMGSLSSGRVNKLLKNTLNHYSLDQEYNAFKQALPAPQRATACKSHARIWNMAALLTY